MEPVLPGTYCVLTVGGISDDMRITAFLLPNGDAGLPRASSQTRAVGIGDGIELPIVQRKGECLTVDVPAGQFGALALQLGDTLDVDNAWLANRPRLDWALTSLAVAGRELRVHGRNIVNATAYPTTDPANPISYGGLLEGKTRFVAQHVDTGHFTDISAAKASSYEAWLQMPECMPEGEYDLFAHNGLGGPIGWSTPLRITVRAATPWPTTMFAVDDYMRESRDADDAIARALADVKANGGGVLKFAAGVYRITRMIELPRRTVLRGEGANRTLLTLPVNHGPAAPIIMLTGDGDFTIEDVRLLGVYAAKLIVAPTLHPGSFDEAMNLAFSWSDVRARNITIRRCFIEQRPRHNFYRRSDTPEYSKFMRDWIADAYTQDYKGFTAIHLKADDVLIEDCTVWGGGSCVVLPGCSHVHIARNTLKVGVTGHGIYAMGHLDWPDDHATNPNSPGAKIRGNFSSQILVEDNLVTACSDRARDLVYFIYGCEDAHVARNRIGDIQVNGDAEGLAFHLWSAKWAKPRLRMTGPTTGLIIDPEDEVGRECLDGAVVEVLDGRGVGQTRAVIKRNGNEIEIDQPWIIAPDEASVISFTAPPPFRRMVLTDNHVWNTGANILLWGNSNDVVLDGNTSSDNGHMTVWSIRLAADQKVWGGAAFTQVIHNRSEMAWNTPHDKNRLLDCFGAVISNPSSKHPTAEQLGYDFLGMIIRDNVCDNQSGIVFRKTFPMGKDSDWQIDDAGIVIERNHIVDSTMGVVIEQGAMAVERGNTFHNVKWPLVWSPPRESSMAVFNQPETRDPESTRSETPS
jgi:hypothetical protein